MREVRFSRGFWITCKRFQGTRTMPKLVACARGLANQELPGADDAAVMIPPTRHGWVRRVPGTAVDLYFVITDGVVTVIAVKVFE